MTESATQPVETANENEQENTPTQNEIANSDNHARHEELISNLEAELEEARKKTKEYEEGWQRSRAEFLNYKKRVERELSEIRERASLDTITKFLPILDDFERAMENMPGELRGNSWSDGIALIQQKFEKIMAEYDIQVIDPTGQEFDPNLHEGIGMDNSDEVESGHVTVTLQKGYKSGDWLLRPALVKVAN